MESVLIRFRPVVWLSVAFLAGCGSEYGATVTGKVTLDGNPVSPGWVTFARVDAQVTPAMSDLDADGSYSLTTAHKLGAVPGSYRVAVQSFKTPEGLAPGERSFDSPEPLVPVKYLAIETSGLEYEIKAGANTIDIPLTSE